MSSTKIDQLAGLKAVVRLIHDHGDSLHWSLSKRSRIWLTLTHWDTEKYNTSVELDAADDTAQVFDALCVLAVAHYLKCFSNGPHTDTWKGIGDTRDLVDECRAVCTHSILSGGNGNADDRPEGTAGTSDSLVAERVDK